MIITITTITVKKLYQQQTSNSFAKNDLKNEIAKIVIATIVFFKPKY